jgi:hypothetical protein
MAEDAVSIELLSTTNSRYQGKIQGIFVISAWMPQPEISLSPCVQDIYRI